MSDASPAGYGVVEGKFGAKEVWDVGKFNEKWRFKIEYESEGGAKAKALGQLDPLRGLETVKAMGVFQRRGGRQCGTFRRCRFQCCAKRNGRR